MWLAEDQNGQQVALKQFPKVRGQSTLDGSAKIEIETYNTLFPNGRYGVDPELNPGIKSIAKLLDKIDDQKDFWLVYEVGA